MAIDLSGFVPDKPSLSRGFVPDQSGDEDELTKQTQAAAKAAGVPTTEPAPKNPMPHWLSQEESNRGNTGAASGVMAGVGGTMLAAAPEAIATKGFGGYVAPLVRAGLKSAAGAEIGKYGGRFVGGMFGDKGAQTGEQVGQVAGGLVGPFLGPKTFSRMPLGLGRYVLGDEEYAAAQADRKVVQRNADIKAGLRKAPSVPAPEPPSPFEGMASSSPADVSTLPPAPTAPGIGPLQTATGPIPKFSIPGAKPTPFEPPSPFTGMASSRPGEVAGLPPAATAQAAAPAPAVTPRVSYVGKFTAPGTNVEVPAGTVAPEDLIDRDIAERATRGERLTPEEEERLGKRVQKFYTPEAGMEPSAQHSGMIYAGRGSRYRPTNEQIELQKRYPAPEKK